MRMRKKPNLAPRLERCASLIISEPEKNRGAWRGCLDGYEELRLELGCGKGRFTAGAAAEDPQIMLLAVERVADAMVVAAERCLDAGIENVRFMDMDALRLREVFAPGEVDRIYINFCDPWPKSRDAKHRLTAPGFLRAYAELLSPGSEIQFKTDNRPLFDWSVEQLCAEGWLIRELTNDLHENGPVGVMTDYEAKFHEQGVRINRLVAVRTETTKDCSAGVPPRLRDSALSDARGN